MKGREFWIRLLLRMYPAPWRREFGAEFEELLQRWPLSVPVMLNVMAGAMGERLIGLFRRIRGEHGMGDQSFGANYDGLAKIASVLVAAILIAVPLMAMGNGPAAAFAALASAAVLGLSFAYSPRGYEISGGAFRVKRPIGDVVIPLERLRYVRDATPADFWGCVRLWGSGGLFGYYGWFWSSALGRTRWYVTDRSKMVVVADGDQHILVSPEDHERFVAAIRAADAGTPSIDPGPMPWKPGWTVILLALVGLGIPLVLIPLAMSYAPGRPPVDLTPDSLIIHSRFYGMTVPASSVDAANVRVVDLQAEPGWKPVSRTNGFGNRNYRAGNFRTANGRTVKLFTTGSARLVLLPPARTDGTPVLLDAEEPDRLAARVRKEWAGR